jgi:hypothetical protein
VAQGRVTSLTLIYSDAWQARYLRSVAAPIVTAQARATATAAGAWQHAAAATAVAAEATRAAAASAPHPPDIQRRTTPSVGVRDVSGC